MTGCQSTELVVEEPRSRSEERCCGAVEETNLKPNVNRELEEDGANQPRAITEETLAAADKAGLGEEVLIEQKA